MDSPKYYRFDIIKVVYKTINNKDINAYIYVPKNIPAGRHPILTKFHGGFFVTGSSIYPEWFPQWLLDLALQKSAIIVTPDYRLLPESTGEDILDDIADFWKWLHAELPSHLSKHNPTIEPDFSKIAAHGESAGGRLAILSAISLLPPGSIKSVIATYPYIGTSPKPVKPIFGAPNIPVEVLANHLNAKKPGHIVTSAFPPERLNLALSMVQQGRFVEFFGSDPRLYPLEVLKEVDTVPFIFILHGTEDTGVPVGTSLEFVDAVKVKFGVDSILLHLEPGAEHGFDDAATLETPWLKAGIDEVVKRWLA